MRWTRGVVNDGRQRCRRRSWHRVRGCRDASVRHHCDRDQMAADENLSWLKVGSCRFLVNHHRHKRKNNRKRNQAGWTMPTKRDAFPPEEHGGAPVRTAEPPGFTMPTKRHSRRQWYRHGSRRSSAVNSARALAVKSTRSSSAVESARSSAVELGRSSLGKFARSSSVVKWARQRSSAVE